MHETTCATPSAPPTHLGLAPPPPLQAALSSLSGCLCVCWLSQALALVRCAIKQAQWAVQCALAIPGTPRTPPHPFLPPSLPPPPPALSAVHQRCECGRRVGFRAVLVCRSFHGMVGMLISTTLNLTLHPPTTPPTHPTCSACLGRLGDESALSRCCPPMSAAHHERSTQGAPQAREQGGSTIVAERKPLARSFVKSV
jgi:hypothetical protein